MTASYRDEFEKSLGDALALLAPLVEAAVAALDKPGSRSLRRKLDGQFHYVVHAYRTLRRASVDQCDWDALRQMPPHYKRTTEVWPGRVTYEALRARADRSVVEAPTVPAAERLAARGLRVVVDNTRAAHAPLATTQFDGGAA